MWIAHINWIKLKQDVDWKAANQYVCFYAYADE